MIAVFPDHTHCFYATQISIYFFSNTGPQNWESLYPEQCAGNNQSPIHIDPKETQFDWRLKDLVVWYDPPAPNSTWIVENDINTYSGIYFLITR